MKYSLSAKELGFAPSRTFEQGLVDTLEWYAAHADWIAGVTSGAYRTFMDTWYGGRV